LANLFAGVGVIASEALLRRLALWTPEVRSHFVEGCAAALHKNVHAGLNAQEMLWQLQLAPLTYFCNKAHCLLTQLSIQNS
jgi:hypothetical protein